MRIKFLLDQFPNRSTFTTICQQNLQDGLILIAQLLKSVIGDPCIDGKLADATRTRPVDCSVSDVSNFGKPNQAEKVLPQCNTGLHQQAVLARHQGSHRLPDRDGRHEPRQLRAQDRAQRRRRHPTRTSSRTASPKFSSPLLS